MIFVFQILYLGILGQELNLNEKEEPLTVTMNMEQFKLLEEKNKRFSY